MSGSTAITAITAVARFGARPSALLRRELRDDVVNVEIDFLDQFAASRTLVDVSQVGAVVWDPSGAVVDPVLVPVEIRPGTWRLSIPVPIVGRWMGEVACLAPAEARVAFEFEVVAADPSAVAGAGPAPVLSLNGRTGNVFLGVADVLGLGSYVVAAAKALLDDSPALGGTPTAPTPALGTNTPRVQTAAGVLAEVAAGATRMTVTQTGANAVPQSVQTKATEFLSARDFGATGNGVTDDTLAINRALAAGWAQRKAVGLPPTAAYYRTTASLVPMSNSGLFGLGGRARVRLEGLTTASIIEATGIDNFLIRDLDLDGDKATKTSASSGIKLTSCTRGLIKSTFVKDCRAWGLYLTSCVDVCGQDIEVVDCQTSSGLFLLGSSYCRFRTVRFRDNGGFGAQVFGGSNNNSVDDIICERNGLEAIGVTSNCFENHFTKVKCLDSRDVALSINGSRNTVSDFYLDGADFHGITLYGTRNSVSNGVIRNCGKEGNPASLWSAIVCAPNFGGAGSYNHISNVNAYDDQAVPTMFYGFRCWTDAHTAWAAGQVIGVGIYRRNAGNIYRATTAGTTALAGPTHASGTAADGGGVLWAWVMTQGTAELNSFVNCQATGFAGAEVAFGGTTTNVFIGRRMRATEGFEFQSPVTFANTVLFNADVSFGAGAQFVAPRVRNGMTFDGLQSVRRAAPAWASGASYIYGSVVANAGRTYTCVSVGGVAANAPVHTSGVITGADTLAWSMTAAAEGAALIRTQAAATGVHALNIQNPSVAEGAGDVTIFAGTGSPEGKVTAGVGSLYLRTEAGAGTTFYVKEAGIGSSGWAAK